MADRVQWKQSVQDISGEVLCGKSSQENALSRYLTVHQVSQFTLLASTKKGNRPDFHGAAGGEQARELYDHFYAKVQELYDPAKVQNGVFQAMMEGTVIPNRGSIAFADEMTIVNIQNSGPVSVDYSSHDGAVSTWLLPPSFQAHFQGSLTCHIRLRWRSRRIRRKAKKKANLKKETTAEEVILL